MIREVLPDVVALVIFTIGGATYGLILTGLATHTNHSFKERFLEVCVGLLGGFIFIILTELYYSTLVTPYTLFCYLTGCIGVLILADERKPKPKKIKPSLLSRFFKKSNDDKKKKTKIKPRSKKTKLRGSY